MDIFILLMFYLWIVGIHAAFVGFSAFMIWGHRLVKMKPVLVIFLLALPLALLEFYWIPIVTKLGLELTTENPVLLDLFHAESKSNLVELFGFKWMHFFIFGFGGFISFRIGKRAYLNMIKKIK